MTTDVTRLMQVLFNRLDIHYSLPLPSIRPIPNAYRFLWSLGTNSKQVAIDITRINGNIIRVARITETGEVNNSRSNEQELLSIARAALLWLYDENQKEL